MNVVLVLDSIVDSGSRIVQRLRVIPAVKTLVSEPQLSELIVDNLRCGQTLGGKDVENLVEVSRIREVWVDDACGVSY